MIKLNNFTASSLVNIGAGKPILAANHTVPLNNIQNYLETFDDQTINAISTTSSGTLTTSDIGNFLDNSAGGMTRTLPAANDPTWTQPLLIKKVDATYNPIVINRAGSDTIENPFNPELVPTQTNYTLYEPNEAVLIYPGSSTTLRIIDSIIPNKILLRAYRNSNFTTTNAWAAAPYDLTSVNTANYYNTSTYVYNPKIPGWYYATHIARFDGANLTYVNVAIYKNGVQYNNAIQSADNASYSVQAQSVNALVYMNGTTDTLEFYYRTPNATKTFTALESVGSVFIISRYA